MLKIKRDVNQQEFKNSWLPFCQIWIIFTHLKLWIASARHNFKCVNITIKYFRGYWDKVVYSGYSYFMCMHGVTGFRYKWKKALITVVKGIYYLHVSCNFSSAPSLWFEGVHMFLIGVIFIFFPEGCGASIWCYLYLCNERGGCKCFS